MKIRNWDTNLKIRLGGEFINNVIFWTFFPFLAIYFSEAFGKGLTGLLLVLSQVLSVIANLLGGYCADRFGRKRMMVIASFGQAAGYGLFALASTPWMASPAAAFAGFSAASVFGSLYWPASQAMVADVVEERHQSQVFAVFYSSVNIAVVIGPLLGSLFYLNHPSLVLAAASACCVGVGLLLGSRLRETAPRMDRAAAASPAGGPWYRFLVAELRQYRIIASDRVFLLFIVAGVLVGQTFLQLDLLFPVFIEETVERTAVFAYGDWHWQLSGQQLFGAIVSLNGFLVALFTVSVTRGLNALRDRYVFVAGALIYAASIALFGQMTSFWGFVFVIVLFTLAELMSAGPQQTFISRLAPDDMRGQYFAASSLRFTLGRTIAPLSIPLSDWIGFPWTFALLAALAVAAAALYNLMFRWHERPASPRQSPGAAPHG
ncbi:MDR family MFS transporter [Cohnella nanjingensis]|uniref:MFS transporter n=1 Tax=Cohnella nanjingensis TaxID=1387779 RepID=A0A7X0VID1_9BACL|nr:MFS transporter [Cohnella nanjingensis]MBB6673539.1 MFS transporter [Cohnella nanjingensis]